MRVTVLASGSSGNALVVEAGGVAILVEAGIAFRTLKSRLLMAGVELASLGAVVVTHEHHDHVKGLSTFLSKHMVPLYATRGTIEALSNLPEGVDVRELPASGHVEVCGVEVETVPTSHDAREPVALLLQHGNGPRIGICTDTGYVTTLLQHRLAGCDALLIEANHDLHMLRNGPYPWDLKQRIRSRYGHLSNDQCREAVEALTWSGLKAVVAMHISENNNTPERVAAALGPVLPGDVAFDYAGRNRMVRLVLDNSAALEAFDVGRR